MIPKYTYGWGWRSHRRIRGADTTARSEPSEECLVMATTTTHTAPATAAAGQERASSAPNEVAIPFPPLNLRNTEQLCPAIAPSPPAHTVHEGSPIRTPRITGTIPLRKSTASTTTAGPAPATR